MLKKISFLIKDTSLLSSSSGIKKNEEVVRAWKEINIKNSHPETKNHIKIKKIENNILYLKASNGAWAQEIQLRNLEIQKDINRKIKTKEYQIDQIIITAGTD